MDLAKAIREQKFRADLAQRFLDTIVLPPLRRRRGDIVKLATFALARWNRKHGERRSIAKSALEKMQAYPWPGNVRELISAVERAAMLARRQIIRADDLHVGEAAWVSGCQDLVLPEPQLGFSLPDYLGQTRATLIERAIASSGGNSAQAARMLGITPQAVHKFLKMQEGEDNPG
jgi:transcriptional regulator with GAF, ATPase, and Fis domain